MSEAKKPISSAQHGDWGNFPDALVRVRLLPGIESRPGLPLLIRSQPRNHYRTCVFYTPDETHEIDLHLGPLELAAGSSRIVPAVFFSYNWIPGRLQLNREYHFGPLVRVYGFLEFLELYDELIEAKVGRGQWDPAKEIVPNSGRGFPPSE